MSKTNKSASKQKANEIKDLLLDMIQQEESSISDTEIFRLSQPYQKSVQPVSPSASVTKDIQHGERVVEHSNGPVAEDTAIKLDFDVQEPVSFANDEEENSFELDRSSPFNVPQNVPQSDKTLKLANVPQSRAPIEFNVKEEKSVQVPFSSNPNEATVRLTPKARSHSYETESRVANGSSGTASGLKFKSEAQIGVSSPTEAVLKQSENLRIAQTRITALEEELDHLRKQNSQLSSAGEILRRRADELLTRSEGFESKIHEASVIFEEERKVLKAQIQSKDRDLETRKEKVDQLEQRLNSQFDSIRRRERELEHRLEILKIENQDILNGKDKMILDLKRQVDLLNTEANFSKDRTQELYNQHKDKQETIRRVVKALRMALTILEGDEETQAPLKKVD